ncbi:MAG: hypothetical protein PHC66_04245 [Candidatus Nanoarchaeia archaeon]|nr:hypothetical protein [Candidatus Nanoarchaeia archaeon]MDD5239356.1 hypothetical protein [Candidatus Nanoarchaeia archaeon]
MVRAQSGLEFITGVTIMLVIYVIAIGAYSYYTENNIIEDTFAEHVCYKFSEGINAAVIGGDGFSINMSVPYKVYADPLTAIRVSGNYTATVEWSDKIAVCSIVTRNITSQVVYSGKVSATNMDSTVYLTSIDTNQSDYLVGEAALIMSQYINGAAANLTIFYSNGTALLGPLTRTAASNSINYTWNTAGIASDDYTVFVADNDYKNLNAEKLVRVR